MKAPDNWESRDASLFRAQQVDNACDLFERAWIAGERPSIESALLIASETIRESLLPELLHIEIFHRIKRRDDSLLSEYAQRFPAVDTRLIQLIIEKQMASDTASARQQVIRSSASTGDDHAETVSRDGQRTRPHPTPNLPGYEILGELGRGGMGVVYQARQIELGRTVAIKMVLAADEGAPDADIVRLRREAAAIAQLNDPRIVQLFEIGIYQGKPYLVMEFVPGRTLADMIQQALPPPRVAAQLVSEIARSIHEVHKRNIVHRDLKPANILVRVDAASGEELRLDSQQTIQPKITDFGLAQVTTDSCGITKSGGVLGTPSYMSPEQVRGESPIGPAADVYGLGAILYELLSGRPPFKSFDVTMTLWEVLNDEPVPPRRLQPRIPLDLNTICLKCLEKPPNNRYSSAADLADDLDRFLRHEPTHARAISPIVRFSRWCQRYPARATAISLAILSAVSLGAIAIIYPFAMAQSRSAAAMRIEQSKTAEALTQVSALRKEAERLSASLAIHQGQVLCERENPARGLLWFARGLTLLPDDRPEMSDATRKNIAAWRRQVHALRHVQPLPRESFGMRMSPSGKLVAIAGYDGFARIFNTQTGELCAPPLKHRQPVTAVAFSADERRLATGTMDGTISLWMIERNELVRTWHAHDEQIYCLIDLGSSSRLVSAGRDAVVQVWNTDDGKRIGQPLVHGGPVISIAATSDGDSLLTGSADRFVRWFRLSTGEAMRAPIEHPSGVMCVAISHNNLTYAVGRQDGTIQIYDAHSDVPLHRLLEHRAMVCSVAFSRDDDWLLTASRDATARLWDVATGQFIGSPLEHQDELCTALMTPDGNNIVTTGDDRTLRIWQVASDADMRPTDKVQDSTSQDESAHRSWTSRQYFGMRWRGLFIQTVGFSPSGRMAYRIAGRSLELGKARDIELYETATAEKFATPLELDGVLHDLAFSPDESHLITVTKKGTACLWHVESGRALKQVWKSPRISAAAFLPDNQSFVVTGPSGVEFKSCADGRELRPPWALDRASQAILFDRSGNRMAIVFEEGDVRILDSRSGEPVAEFDGRDTSGVGSVAFSDSGEDFLVSYWGGMVCVWNLRFAPPPMLRLDHPEAVWAAKFSPDGKTVAVASSAGNVYLWNALSGEQSVTPFQQREFIDDLDFTPDGHTLLLGTYEKKLRLVDVSTGWALGPARYSTAPIQHVRFLSNGSFYQSGDQNLVVRKYAVASSGSETVTEIRNELEALSGLRLGTDNIIRCLSAEEWNTLASQSGRENKVADRAN